VEQSKQTVSKEKVKPEVEAPATEELSLQQKFNNLKEDHPGYLLLFKGPNYYKMWFEQATLGSHITGINSKTYPDGNLVLEIPLKKYEDATKKLKSMKKKFKIVTEGEGGAFIVNTPVIDIIK
jgi:DNA mismatch repair ATPase MutS